MDSTPDGVHSGNLHRMIFAHSSYIKVLRLKHEYKTSQVILQACEYVRSKFSQEYGKAHAFMSVPWAKAKDPGTKNRAFCSRLVANAFSAGGLNIVDNVNFASPQDINKSEYFDEISDITKPANELEINAPFEKNNILDQQKSITNELFTSFRKASNKDIQTFEQAISAALTDELLDGEFTDIIKRSGYFELKDKAFSTITWIKKPVNFLFENNFIDLDDYKRRVKNELRSFSYNLVRYETQRDAFWSLAQDYPDNQLINSLLMFYKSLVQDYLIAKQLFNGMLESERAIQLAVNLPRN